MGSGLLFLCFRMFLRTAEFIVAEVKILLIDADALDKRKSHPAFHRKTFPNLALMKLSAFHKQKGDAVFLNFPLAKSDITYVSKVFTWSKDFDSKDAIYGGIGINPEVRLPEEVEHIMPDYSLYDIDFSMGYTSRGCPRKCPWCKVPSVWGCKTLGFHL